MVFPVCVLRPKPQITPVGWPGILTASQPLLFSISSKVLLWPIRNKFLKEKASLNNECCYSWIGMMIFWNWMGKGKYPHALCHVVYTEISKLSAVASIHIISQWWVFSCPACVNRSWRSSLLKQFEAVLMGGRVGGGRATRRKEKEGAGACVRCD